MTAPGPTFRYTVAMPRPHRHLFEVAFDVAGPLPGDVDVRLPVWSPGSYLVREYARNIQDLRVVGPAGRDIPFEKTNKNTWRIRRASGGFRFTFRVFANEASVQSLQLDDTHAFIHPPAMCPYVDGYLDRPCEITVVPEPGWRVATGLARVRGGAARFRAGDYDELADSPIECGPFQATSFVVSGRRHRIVVSGGGEFDMRALARDAKRVVEEVVRFWKGPPPYRDYTFICHVYPGARGGLEHRNSTVLGIDSHAFRPQAKYVDSVLSLVAHEFFHTWNVKRIRPAVLGPFDYSQENYTRLLWVFEGVTSYYDTLLVCRAGLVAPSRYLKHVSANIGKLLQTPGRRRQSLAEASFDTWIKFYRQNEHSPNAIVSYYLKGELVALLLDLHIRERTDGRRSLDDVMRALWRAYTADGAGMDERGFERAASEVSGLDLRPFFRRAVHSTAELDFGEALEPFGLRLVAKVRGADEDGVEGGTPSLGLETDTRNGMLAVKTVLDGSAADRAGLSAGDVLLALDGYRVTPDSFKTRLKQYDRGRSLEVTFFRRERLRTAILRFDGSFELEYAIEAVGGATARARRLRDSWLGSALDATPARAKRRKGR